MTPTQALGHTVANTLSLTISILATTLAEVYVVNKFMKIKNEPGRLQKMGITVVALMVIAVAIVWLTKGDILFSLFGISSAPAVAAATANTMTFDEMVLIKAPLLPCCNCS